MSSTYSQLHFHIIFGVKERCSLINATMRERLHQYIGGIVRKEGGVLQAIGGSSDHIHILAALPPSRNAADIVRVVKSNSSKWIHDEFPQMKVFSWQVGYGAFSVSHSNVEAVKGYIENQEEHHRKMSFSQEWKAILEKHGIELEE